MCDSIPPVRFACLVVLLGLAAGATAVHGQDKPFLTAASYQKIEKAHGEVSGWKANESLFVNTREQIAFAWSDQPFAVNIPFTAPDGLRGGVRFRAFAEGFAGRILKKKEDADAYSLKSSDPDKEETVKAYVDLRILTGGIYRLDGASMTYEVKRQDGTLWGNRTYAYNDDNFRRMGFLDKEDGVCGQTGGYFKNVTLNPKAGHLTRHLAAANLPRPTPMIAWFVVDPRSFCGMFRLEEIQGEIVVQYDKAWHAYESGQTQYLPPAPEQRLSVKIKQNGWAVMPEAKEQQHKNWENPDVFAYKDSKGNSKVIRQSRIEPKMLFDGRKLKALNTIVHQESSNRDGALDRQFTAELTYDFEIPTRIWDHWPYTGPRGVMTCTVSDPGRLDVYRPGIGAVADTQGRYWDHDLKEPEPGKPGAKGAGPAKPGVKELVVEPTKVWPGTTFFPDGKGWGWNARFYEMPDAWLTQPEKIGEKRLMVLALGCGPDKWNRYVQFYYKRLSEMEDNKTGGKTTAQAGDAAPTPDDGYWDWKTAFVPAAEEYDLRKKSILTQLAGLYENERKIEDRFMALMARFYEMPRDEDVFGQGEDGIPGAAGRVRIHALYEGALRKQMAALRQEKADTAADKGKLIKEAQGKIDNLILKVQEQRQKSQDRPGRAQLRLLEEKLQAEKVMLGMQLQAAAGQLGERDTLDLIEKHESRADEVGKRARLTRALWHWQRARQDQRLALKQELDASLKPDAQDAPRPANPLAMSARSNRHDALLAARRYVRETPYDDEGRALQAEIETWYIGLIQRKVEREKHVVMQGFVEYLKNHDIKPEAPDPDKMPDVIREYWDYVCGAGPGNIYLAVVDMPGLLGDEAALVQANTVKNHMSLRLIKRLLKNGLVLPEIRVLGQEALGRRLGLNTPERQKLAPHQEWRLAQDMKETFNELGDLDILAAATTHSDMTRYDEAVKLDYYFRIDPDQSWGEWFGEIGSPRNLLALGLGSPMGQQAMCRILRLESWGARIVPGRVRAILAGSMKEYWDIYNAASTYRQFMMTADRLAAAAVFYGSASYLCQLWNMPGARFLVDVLGTIGAHEIAADLIARSGVQRELIESAVKRVAADTAKRKANHKAVEEAVKEMEQIAARVESASAQGPLLSADDKVKLDSIGKSLNKTKPPVTLTMEEIKASGGLEAAKASVPPPPRPKELPPTDAAPAADDTVMVQEVKKRLAAQEPKATDTAVLSEVDTESAVHHAASSAKEALDGGNAAEGKRALGCAKKLGGQHKAALESTEAASASALALVQPAPPAPRRAQVVAPNEPLYKVKPTAFTDDAAYATPHCGDDLLAADRALRKDDLAAAAESYRQCGDAAKRNGQPDVDLLASNRRNTVSQALQVRALRLHQQAAANLLTDRPIPPETVQKVLAALKDPGNVSPVFRYVEVPIRDAKGNTIATLKRYILEVNVDNETYLLKVCSSSQDPVVETLGAGLAKRLGIDCAETRPVPDIDGLRTRVKMKDGKEVWATLEGFGSLSRKIPGTVAELRSFTEAELIAFKKEYARQRVLRAWLADSDGHMGNQVVCEDGRLRAIDFGLGTVRDGSGESLRQFGIIRAGDDVDYMRQALNLSSDPGFQTLDQEGKYLWINRADEILDYDADMAPTVQMIVEMCNDRGPTGLASIVRERLRAPDGVVNENEVQAVMGVLRKRAENLETVLKERLDRVVADAVKKQAMLWDRLPAHRPLAVARPQPAVPRPLFAPSPRPGEALAASLRQPLAA